MPRSNEFFYRHIAQTSELPLGLEIEKAMGSWIFTLDGKKYLDLISGISVSNTGHLHPHVIAAIQAQLGKYLHTMVYGEHIQSPQVRFAKKLSEHLPVSLNTVYFTNSGAEAVEGAMKLAKRYTGKTNICSFRNAYHGSTQGALSIMGSEEFKNSFRPLLPGTTILEFNDLSALNQIDEHTAAVFVEPVQGEAGVVPGKNDFMKALRNRCTEKGALLIFDEIQTGFGRTGSLFAFQHYGVIPDILVCAKGMGGGMPLGGFISSSGIMSSFVKDPVLGHLTTFGGHPLSCAAGLAAFEVLESEGLVAKVKEKEALFVSLLQHPKIKALRHSGLLLAMEFESPDLNQKVIQACLERGVITDWFLFNATSLRLAPPLTISEEEIRFACRVLLESISIC